MKYVVTGASGFVGRQLVPRLQNSGAELLLVGRDPEALSACFPHMRVASYAQWPAMAQGWDVVIHLAALNNDQPYSDEDFHRVNVDLTQRLAEQARNAKIHRFVAISSVHALDETNQSGYAVSKRLAAQSVTKIQGIHTQILTLPLVYGDTWAGKLAFLNRLPRMIANAIFRPLAALKPTLHVDSLAQYLLSDSPDSHIVLSEDQDKNGIYRGATVIINWAFAVGVLVTLWWALALIWVLVRWTSPGPGIFAQERVGQNEAPFTCYKFRTMAQGTPQAGTHDISTASVTRVGGFLRKTKLDELPQILNILRGDIHLVGPRPGLPVQQELLASRRRRGIFSVKPGITGWAQIHEIDMSTPEELSQWDQQYIALRGLLLDIRILLLTAFGKGLGDRVRKN